jgi:hypothetical protein
MLYQVATGLLSVDQISGPLRSILSRQANVEVLMDEVSGAYARDMIKPAWGTGEWGHSRFLPAAAFLVAGDSKWRIAETLLILRGYIRL